MTVKQCNSCKYHIYVKELKEHCFYIFSTKFMKKGNCEFYKNGDINEAHKDFFMKCGQEYPFTEMK